MRTLALVKDRGKTSKQHAVSVYRPLEARIQKGDLGALLARWEFGRKLLEERVGARRLPNGRLEQLAKALGSSPAELGNRMQFATEYPSRAKVAAAFKEHGSWSEICTRGMGDRGGAHDGPATLTLVKTDASAERGDHGRRVLATLKARARELERVDAWTRGLPPDVLRAAARLLAEVADAARSGAERLECRAEEAPPEDAPTPPPAVGSVCVPREQLRRHLDRIGCGGRIAEAVFTGAFATSALTPDRNLLVLAPALEGAEGKFEGEVGVPSLTRLTRGLRAAAGDGFHDAAVILRLEDHRLIVDEGERGAIPLLLADANTIATRADPEVVARLHKKGDGYAVKVNLHVETMERVVRAFSALKARRVEIAVGPSGGILRVGEKDSDSAEFPVPGLTASERYAVTFPKHFAAALAALRDADVVTLRLGGPEDLAVLEGEGYAYYVSPIEAREQGERVAAD